MTQPLLKYKVEIPLNTKINYSLADDDLLEENVVLLHEPTSKTHTLFARLSDLFPEIKDFLIESLILETSFSEAQDLPKLYQVARNHINQYLYIIRYVTREDSATLINREALVTEVLDGEEHQYRYHEIFPPQSTDSITRVHFLTRETFEFLLNAPSINFEKYIDIFVDVSNLRDPIARLIGFASLTELINHEVGAGTIVVDDLAKAARNLVAHGFVSGQTTVTSLNDQFNK
ncbi:hypothetical protein [Stenomitos frigidus]|nr:hypothetical protein [Stenomitos frigidus]